jgi:hypothetical protein
MNDTELTEALKEARDLLDGMKDVTADGRRTADELAETIRNFAAIQCGAIEARIADLGRRLALLEQKAKPA